MLVYLITNKVNSKQYVGQTKRTMARRWKQHQVSPGCAALNSAIKKYGVDNFTIEILYEPITSEVMNALEAHYIWIYNTLSPNGYNLKTGGDRVELSEETRRKISRSQKGKKPSLDARRKMSEAQSRRLPPSEETRRKLTLAQMGNKKGLGRKNSEEHRAILRRPKSAETRLRMSQPKSEEHKKKIGLAHVGMKRSEEALQNMRIAQQARRLKETADKQNL